MTVLDAQEIINQLASRLAQMEVDLAIARSQLANVRPQPEETEEDGVTILEVIDGEKPDNEEEKDE